MVYQVVSVRRDRGMDFVEGSFEQEGQALNHLISLHSDQDCLLAEIQKWSTGGSKLEPVPVIAQYERRDGNWIRVIGDLRCRTFGGDAGTILAAAS